ncbi:hypothetical protein QQ045_003794 [Rhodiola kirilowii]
MKGHWDRTCRTPKHFVDVYKASLKEKGVETNFIEQKDDDPMNLAQLDPMNLTYLDVSDFFEDVNGDLKHPIEVSCNLIGDARFHLRFSLSILCN